MRNRLSFLIVALLSTVTPAWAQYPTYQWINPYPREEIGRRLVFSQPLNQSRSLDVEGRNQCEITPSPEGLKIVSTGGDPYFWTQPLVAKDNKPITETVEFSLTMKSDCGATGQIFWSEGVHDGFDEGRSVRFDVINDGKFHTYTGKAILGGKLRKVRIDPGTDKGTAVISKLEITRIERSPIEITNMVSNNDFAEIEITNHSEKQVWISSSKKATKTNRPLHNVTIEPGKPVKITMDFPKNKPFEIVDFDVFLRGHLPPITRIAYAFHEDKETDWVKIENGDIQVLFAKDGSGAKIIRDGETIGVLLPLCGKADTTGLPIGIRSNTMELVRSDAKSITFKSSLKSIRNLTFAIEGNELRFELDATENTIGPVFRPLGVMEQAVLSGVEYLEKGEHSSSTADLETAEHVRFSPDPWKMTMPFMGIITDKCSFGLLWDDPLNTRVQFATPDFLEGKQPGDMLQNRMGLVGAKTKGTLRIGPAHLTGTPRSGETIEDAVLWAVDKRGVPNLPPTPRSKDAQKKLNLAGLEDSELKQDGKWAHAILPGGGQPFARTNSADCVSTIWQLTGVVPEGSRQYARGGAHLENPCVYFLTGQAQDWLNQLNGQAESVRKQQKEDGSFRYQGKYLKGHWEDTASGFCGNLVVILFDHYLYIGNTDSLAAALKGTDYFNTFRVPRGAQTWELSLHTPDIMGSGWCCLANVRAFEATGKEEYLKQARRWAISGLPFVYQWDAFSEQKQATNGSDKIIRSGSSSRPSGDGAVMVYATTPVLGATNWSAPNWIGLPVQWCGLDYAEALYLLAPHDKTLDWKKIADGILIAGEQMQYEKGPSIGLLPDSWTLKTQKPNPYDINPVVLERLRRRADGELPALDVQISPDGKTRVVAPFPIRFDGNTPIVDAPKGTETQILVNGKVSDKSAKKKQIVFIGGPKSHGYGMHTHTASFKLLAEWLDTYTTDTQSKVYINGWPDDPNALDGADCVVVYCDGGGGHIAIPHLEQLKKHVAKGGGVVMYHFAVEVPQGEAGDFFLDAIGGYYEAFFTTTQWFNAEFKTIPTHPVTRGIKPFSLEEEWYFNIRFRPGMKGVTPLLSCVPPDAVRMGEDSSHFGNATVRGEKGKLEHLAWCTERADGGRGLGFTGGHWHWNWGNPTIRKFVLNAIAWTAGAEVPENGIDVPTPSWEKLLENQDYEPNLSPEDTKRWQDKIRQWDQER